MEDLNKDPAINSQPTKIFFEKDYIFNLHSLNEKLDHILAHSLKNTKANDTYFIKFNSFQLSLNFLIPKKKRDFNCSHDVMLNAKLTHAHTYYVFKQIHNLQSSLSHTPYCIETTNLHGIIGDYESVQQMYIFAPLSTNSFPIEDSQPIIISSEYIQTGEIPFLENIFGINFNHQLFNHPKYSSWNYSNPGRSWDYPSTSAFLATFTY